MQAIIFAQLHIVRNVRFRWLAQPDGPLATRYIWAKAKIHGFSGHPLALLKSDLLSRAGKLRLMSEPFTRHDGKARTRRWPR